MSVPGQLIWLGREYKPHAIVDHGDDEALRCGFNPDGDVLRLGVLQRIVQGLLDDPVGTELYFWCERQ